MKFISGTSHICKPTCPCVPVLGWQRERWAAYWQTHENRGGLLTRRRVKCGKRIIYYSRDGGASWSILRRRVRRGKSRA